ncbi:hypothetical protein HY485_03200 [Candidatus Woesearchaeota archaeon]|nr:hypothetical protein [Candidatus Woesearchaeota archaeon]
MNNYLKIATLALPFLFGGCESEMKEPKREDYNKCNVVMHNSRGQMIGIIDENSDGEADYFTQSGRGIIAVADDLHSKVPSIPTMSAAVRDAASRVIQAQRDLEFIADKEIFEARKKK